MKHLELKQERLRSCEKKLKGAINGQKDAKAELQQCEAEAKRLHQQACGQFGDEALSGEAVVKHVVDLLLEGASILPQGAERLAKISAEGQWFVDKAKGQREAV